MRGSISSRSDIINIIEILFCYSFAGFCGTCFQWILALTLTQPLRFWCGISCIIWSTSCQSLTFSGWESHGESRIVEIVILILTGHTYCKPSHVMLWTWSFCKDDTKNLHLYHVIILYCYSFWTLFKFGLWFLNETNLLVSDSGLA